ncbi:hypothetical protein F7725_018018 [Dissostichus mawsoni]|uniref:Uncharacterized protein n=1 Tax=Dissostichus mawsoni TaxID=36200 RepID=A0A7J5XQU0_DISMA|nr:hypothetical protein F7725_018018 [Dissostichus mawsoni]
MQRLKSSLTFYVQYCGPCLWSFSRWYNGNCVFSTVISSQVPELQRTSRHEKSDPAFILWFSEVFNIPSCLMIMQENMEKAVIHFIILGVISELLFSQRKERGDPEEEQDRLTELLNSTSSVLLEVTVTLETGSVAIARFLSSRDPVDMKKVILPSYSGAVKLLTFQAHIYQDSQSLMADISSAFDISQRSINGYFRFTMDSLSGFHRSWCVARRSSECSCGRKSDVHHNTDSRNNFCNSELEIWY